MANVYRLYTAEMRNYCGFLKYFRSSNLDCCKYSTTVSEKTSAASVQAQPGLASKSGTTKTSITKSLPDQVKGRLKKEDTETIKTLSHYAKVYYEFLPDPDVKHRHILREKLERRDMLARRKVLDIPEFYVGSIVAVTISDIHAPGKTNRFLGICIDKHGAGLRCNFILRNVIDLQGIEINFDMYDPTIQMIECIRLEKRLDERLWYLRDAPLEYSTFPQDMKPEYLPEGSKVPVNDTLVPMNPRPYQMKWHQHELKGVANLDIGYRAQFKIQRAAKPWEKYDLMKHYRETIPDEDRLDIFRDVHNDLDNLEKDRRKKIRNVLVKRSKKKLK